MRVLVFGASITQGFWDTEGGWVQRLRRHYYEIQIKNPGTFEQPTVFNLGVSGDSTRELLLRFGNEAKARQWPNERYAFIFSVGTNNARADRNGKTESSPEEYRADLEALVQKAKDYSDKVMFVGSPRCDEHLTTPVLWADIYYRNDAIFRVEKIMREVAAKNNCPHIAVFETFKKRMDGGERLFADGLHPNNAGHELIFQLVRPELDKLLAS